MTALSFDSFLGTVPRIARHLLADGQAQFAVNCRLTDGTLSPFNAPKLLATPVGVTGTIKTLWRMYSGAEYWLTWSKQVAIVKSPIFPDRIYWTGDGEPRQTNISTAIGGTPYPFAWYALGIPAPTVAAGLSASGGVGAATTRSYVYTRIDTWGQESAPSPAVTVTGKVDDTWALTGLEADPSNSGSVTAATHSSGTVTVTIGTHKFFRVGEEITFSAVGGMTDLNGTFEITGLTGTTQVKVALTTAQTYTSGGSWARRAPFIVTGMAKNIYRTIGGTYFFVAQVTGTTHNDTASDATVALNDTLPSLFWEQPPTDLVGLDVLSNGSICSISGNQVRFSEPGSPHAWPSAYSVQLSHPGVNLKTLDNTVIVGTTGPAWVLTGTDPISMSGLPHPASWPCLAFSSMCKGIYGVEYACPEGLAVFSPGGEIASRSLFTEVEWGALAPATFIAAHHAGRYYFGYTIADESAVLIMQRGEPASLLKANVAPSAIYACEDTAKLYMVVQDSVYEWDGDLGAKMSFDWMSREATIQDPNVFRCASVDADYEMTAEDLAASQAAHDAVVASNEAIIAALKANGSLGSSAFGIISLAGTVMKMPPPVIWEAVLFQYYVDGALKGAKSVTGDDAFRLPLCSSDNTFAVRVSGNVPVKSIHIASSMQELRAI